MMALIKKLKTENIIDLIRDSFDDRFHDYFIEILSNYLSFEDKLKFQFISKQWMRSVFHSQIELDLRPIFLKLYDYYYRDISGNEDNIVNAIEYLLKSCSQINQINVDYDCLIISKTLNASLLEKLVLIFADNFKHLHSFHLKSKIVKEFDTNLWEFFGEKCGKNIRNADLSIIDRNNCRVFLRQCPNLTSLEGISLFNLIDVNSGETLVPKLTEVKHLTINKGSVELMGLFATKYASTLKCLGIDLHKPNPKVNNSCLSHISKLTNLESLDLTLSDTPIDDNLNQIAVNCKKLISLRLRVQNLYSDLCKNTMHSLSRFRSLNKLEIETPYYSSYGIGGCIRPIECHNKVLMTNMFKECTHLTDLYMNSSLDDNFFSDINDGLSQIKVLRIKTIYCLRDQSLRYLSKLTELKVLDITCLAYRHGLQFTDDGICDLMDTSKQLKSLIFGPIPDITTKTVDKLIEVAKQRSNISFYHYFNTDQSINYGKSSLSLQTIESLRHKIFPKNLKLIIE